VGVIPSLLILGLLALVAAALAKKRPLPSRQGREQRWASVFLAAATLLQAVHFAEELVLDFHVQFPAVFGLTPIPVLIFILFNLGCLFLWTYSVYAIRRADNIALAAAWFLALAGILNGLAHPVLAVVSDTYFPGLLSSIPLAAVCCGLSISLIKATKPRSPNLIL